jgi:hypothetical protein
MVFAWEATKDTASHSFRWSKNIKSLRGLPLKAFFFPSAEIERAYLLHPPEKKFII